ncbi:hypothetical protein CLV30_106140 [Haloactinopolyspora alba]|uniref:Tail assembly chaperone n=1 Tax=Haloactinopolyspora alba TaxID=648780 RepID=A0A2P8E3T3_9ACTN|nr:phage tail assembly protein [Haloactinopolyspora alba]PSL04135.1 hypothetical protein CLV30_106140 [Haloactinopolyspora alba]
MTAFTLDDIRAYAEEKYADVTITLPDAERESGEFKVVMLNPLRLGKEARDEVSRLQAVLDKNKDADEEDDVDQEAVLREVLGTVCERPIQGEKLNAALSDLTMVAAVFDKYTKGTSAGEA